MFSCLLPGSFINGLNLCLDGCTGFLTSLFRFWPHFVVTVSSTSLDILFSTGLSSSPEERLSGGKSSRQGRCEGGKPSSPDSVDKVEGWDVHGDDTWNVA